jgi:membrane protease YdiL (CAAX protease family)
MIQMLAAWVANLQNIPAPVLAPLIAAFAIEACLYALPVIEGARRRLQQRVRPPTLALLMTASAAVPYCVYALPTHLFRPASLAAILALASVASFWYVFFPRRPTIDLAYVAVVAAVMLLYPFARIYGTPVPSLPLAILGSIMWTRLALFACLSLANMRPPGFGFLPQRREWAAGAFNFLLFLPVGALAGWLLKLVRFHPPRLDWRLTALIAVATFLGMLWVVALREEFFFRGLLQRWLARWLGNDWAALAVASVLFGLLHLPFRGFPNWRFALLATLAGVFYGRAYLTTRSVRAAMVTHALVNTVWRVFFW